MTSYCNPDQCRQAFGEVLQHAEKIKNDNAHRVEVMDVGDIWAQGDVGLVRIERLPVGAVPIKSPSAQLAPGVTQGSRHCIADLASCRLFMLPDASPLDGPVIDAPEGLTV